MSDWQELPWLYPPPGFQPFDITAVLATPSSLGVESLVLSFKVPLGMDGVVKAVSHNYTGGSFSQGSGQLVWRIRVHTRVLPNYEQILFEFGSPQVQRPLSGGIVVRSNQVFQYLVICNDAVLTSSTNIICSVSGYFWPKDKVLDRSSK